MSLQNLLMDNRTIWQENTQHVILNSMLCKSHRYKLLGQNDERLVMVFGKSHAGKTTMILTLMGVKEELLREVSMILRAGIPEGKSSTSTAVIYQRSDDDMFGLREGELSDIKSEDDVLKCSQEEFISNLAGIRNDVERGVRDIARILYIYIPAHYFMQDNDIKSGINILDVPGFETSNTKEKNHTDALLSKYMTVASLCIVVRSFYDINDLRYFTAPNRDDASKLLSGKYIIVTTHSYSPENIAAYFRQPKEARTLSFEEYIRKECDEQFRRIFPNGSPKVFCVDLGESFDELVNNKINDTEDREILREYRNNILQSIYSCIMEKKGNSLLDWLKELKEDEEFYRVKGSEKYSEEYEKKKNKKDSKEAGLQKIRRQLEAINGEIDVFTEQIEQLNNQKKEVLDILMKEDWNRYVDEIKNRCFDEKYKRRKNIKASDVAEAFAETLKMQIDKYLEGIENLNTEVFASFEKTDLYKDIIDRDRALRESILKSINAHPVLKVLNPSNREKIGIGGEKLSNALNDISDEIEKEVLRFLSEMIAEEGNNLRLFIKLRSRNERKSKKLQKEIDNISENLAQIERCIEEVNYRARKDQDIINEYKAIAASQFRQEKNRIITILNEEGDSAVKMDYIILLGLMNKDYDKLMMR